MRIDRLRLHGFGKLRGELSFDARRCSLIIAPNEAGKSTLVAALVTGLYGLPPERRSKNNPIPSRDAFRPWDGGSYAVEVEFRLGAERYALRRDLATDRTEVIDARTGKDIADDFRGEGGRIELLERLVGLDRDDFSRSALVMQEDIESIREGGDITLRLQRFATSHGGDITAGEAVECLEESLRRYPGTQLAGGGRVETEVRRLEDRLQEIVARQGRLEREHDGAAADLEQLDRLAAEERGLAAKLHRLDYLRTRAIVTEIDAQIDAQEQAAEEHRALAAELESLERYRGFPVDAGGEINELKGKIAELDARIAGARDELRAGVDAPLHEARAALAPLAPLERLTGDDAARLEAISVRLADLREQLRTARQALRDERRKLRRSNVDAAALAAATTRLRGLTDDDERFLEGFRERLLELEARRRAILDDRRPPPRAPLDRLVAVALGLALAVAGALLWSLAGQSVAGGALIGVGLLAAGFGLAGRRRRVAAEPPEFRVLLSEIDALEERAESLAARVGLDDADLLIAEFRRRQELKRETGGLAGQEAETERIEDALGRTRDEAAEILRRAGRDVPGTKIRRRDVEALRDDLRESERLRARVGDLEERGRRTRDEIQALQKRRHDLDDRMRGRLAEAGIDADHDDPEEMRARFEAAAAAARRRLQIEQEALPAALAKLVPAERLARQRDERRTMAELIEEIRARGTLHPLPEATESSNQYVLEFKRAEVALQEVQRRRREVFARVGEVLRRYREEGPQLAEERARLEIARTRAQRFARAVTIAIDRLREISRESYEEWAIALNDRANRSLAHLNPSYRDMRFDTDLSFTIEDVASGRRLTRDEVDAQLSAGARDQVYLAVRLAVSDYFSAGRFRLPLVLDEPFLAADDERFDRALAFLAERVSPRHQVILLSCQAERHRAFRERRPDLFDARIARIDLPSSAS